MRFLLASALALSAIGSAHAANYDNRLYLVPSVGYTLTDPGRGTDYDWGFSLTAGLPMCECRNYEVELGYQDLDGTEIYNINASLLTYFDENNRSLFSILGLGAQYVEGFYGNDYASPNLTAGLGALLPGFGGKFRIEALLRGDLHFDESAGLGGKKAFVEPIFRIGYQIPLGPEPQIDQPEGSAVDVVAPAGSDTDGDGVVDNNDLCPGTPMGTVVDRRGCAVDRSQGMSGSDCREPVLDEAVDAYGCAVDKSVILNGVNFEFDSDTLTSEANAILDDVARVLMTMDGTTAEIAGHTSDEGDEYYNVDLSQRRAARVREYLIEAGVAADQLTAKGYGGSAPLTANDSYEGRRRNRRVEIKTAE